MLKTRLVNAAFIVAIIAGLAVMFVFVLPQLSKLRPSERISSTPVILQQVQTLSQLVTVKYVMEKVVILNDIQPYKEFFIPGSGENRVLMVAHGIVKAGVGLGVIQDGDIHGSQTARSQKKIIIQLAPAP